MTSMTPVRDVLLEDDHSWHDSLSASLRDPAALLRRLELPETLLPSAIAAAGSFSVMAPESYLNRMRPGDITDPLLRQVLPLSDELQNRPGFVADAVGDRDSRIAPGLLKKYQGRALLVLTGACAVHCRYCFRRHYAYSDEPKRLADWEPALTAIESDDSIQEILLSGGDPLMVPDRRLSEFVSRLQQIPHVKRLRIHSRLPVVLPDRVTSSLLDLLTSTRLTPIMVVHANHPNEVVDDCADAFRMLVRSGITTLNQAVLLKGINDDIDVLQQLCERLINVGVIPYYLHQLDRVEGAAHFEVAESVGVRLIDELRRRLPGYAVPEYVREEAGYPFKRPLP